jgi:serine/threonine protein kinase
MPPHTIPFWDIRITEDNSAGRHFMLQQGSLSVGASPDCEIVSSAAGVAPRHAEFSVNAGVLQLRIFDDAAPVDLNGAPVRGPVDVRCPATIQIGALSVFITHSGSTSASLQNSDSTIRIVHPASPRFPQLSDPEGLDVTGRIVYQLPEAEEAASPSMLAGHTDLQPQKTSASFSSESTMAFSMESLDLEIADKVPVRIDYEVKEEIARGGMGKIYSAADSELDRLVALKVSTAGDRGRDSQFFREAKILAALAHPNIVPIHNLGVDAEGRPFYSMKLIQGRTLQWILKQLAGGDRSIALVYTRDRLLDIFRKVCDAVSFSHSKGYLHRDLKPENIMVGEFGEVLVMDWGLAKVIRKTAPGAGPAAGADIEPETLSYIEGTPQYMSPEQANGMYGGLDECSDIYSLGGVLYAILTYRPPVSGASVAEVIQKVRSGETTTMTMPRRSGAGADPTRIERAVPEALRAVTLKALGREKTKRYQSVSALVADIEAYQSGFATGAEDASLFRQVWLLVKRHRMAAALMFLFACGSVVFTVKLADSEKMARANSDRADKERQHAENEARSAAEQKLLAEENARRADSEKQAARKALAQTQLTVAEASEQRFNVEEMDTALRQVDPEFRTQEWDYLNSALHSELRTYEAEAGFIWRDCVPHPEKPGVMIALQSGKGYNVLRILNLNTGDFDKPFTEAFKMDGDIEPASLAVSRDASLVAILEKLPSNPGIKAETHQIAVWNLATREKTKLAETSVSGRALLEFSPDGRKVMKVCMYAKAGSQEAGLSMFDVQTGKKLWQLPCDSPYDAEFDPNSGRVHYVSSTESLELNPGDGLQSSRPSIPLQGTSSSMPVLMKGLHVFKTLGPSLRHYVSGKAHFEVKLPGNLIGRMNLAVTTKDTVLRPWRKQVTTPPSFRSRNWTTAALSRPCLS